MKFIKFTFTRYCQTGFPNVCTNLHSHQQHENSMTFNYLSDKVKIQCSVCTFTVLLKSRYHRSSPNGNLPSNFWPVFPTIENVVVVTSITKHNHPKKSAISSDFLYFSEHYCHFPSNSEGKPHSFLVSLLPSEIQPPNPNHSTSMSFISYFLFICTVTPRFLQYPKNSPNSSDHHCQEKTHKASWSGNHPTAYQTSPSSLAW